MNTDILTFLIVLAVTIVLFLSGRLPYDMTAFAALIVLFLLGFLESDQVFIGCSSSAVIIFISTFFLAGALKRTGVTNSIATMIASKVGTDIKKNVVVVMLIGAIVSAFMSNVATVALLLPTVVGIARINQVSVSQLLIPMAFAVILGGLLTVIGSTANIVAIDLQKQAGLEVFHFFEFLPFGLTLLVASIIYITYRGYLLLPRRAVAKTRDHDKELKKVYRLNDELFYIKFSKESVFVGKTLAESEIGKRLGIRVVATFSRDNRRIFPKPDQMIKDSDRLLAFGSPHQVEELVRFRDARICGDYENSELENLNYSIRRYLNYDEYQSSRKDNEISETAPRAKLILNNNDLQVVASRDLRESSRGFYLLSIFEPGNDDNDLKLSELPSENLFKVDISNSKDLIGQKANQILTVRNLGFKILAVERNKELLIIDDNIKLEADDLLLCVGSKEVLNSLDNLQGLEISFETKEEDLESTDIGFTEVVLSPRSKLIGKTLTEVNFRDKYDFQVMAIWRKGNPVKGNLADVKLSFGDALLLQGPNQKIHLFDEDFDFLLLYDNSPAERKEKAPFAILALVLMIVFSSFGILPVALSAMVAALIVVFSGAIKMEEAYLEVSWRVVFLVAALLPIGIAFQTSGAADYISNLIINLTGSGGQLFALFILVLAASILSQTIDVIIAIVLIGQVAISMSNQMGIDSDPLLMAVTCGAALAFLTPFSHKASLLVMGAGGYSTKDYFKVGSILTIILIPLLVLMIHLIY